MDPEKVSNLKMRSIDPMERSKRFLLDIVDSFLLSCARHYSLTLSFLLYRTLEMQLVL